MKILGIDEAGRGPVLGPLVMCGYLIDSRKSGRLLKAGAKDSKLLTPAQRENIAVKMRKLADDFVLLSVPASEIDALRSVSNLNKIEIERMQEIIIATMPDVAIIDAPEVNTKAFAEKIRKKVGDSVKLICENFADARHPPVSAASILAKVHRDSEIEKLSKKYGNIGSGYTSDEITIKFLKDWIAVHRNFPPFVRKSWITAQVLLEQKQQAGLGNFK